MQDTQTPWWGKIGLLWLIFVPLCMAIYVLAQPLAPNDLWYHLRAGAWIVQHHSFPRVAMFTPSVPANTPYFYQSWIAEIVMYLTLKWSGLAGSQILRAVCFTGAIGIFMASAQRRAKVLLPGVDSFNDGARRVVLVGLFALLMCIPNTDLRPQTFSVPLFAVFAAVIFDWSNSSKRQLIIRTICLIGLMALWANTHGAFVTGLIMLLLFCIGETIHFRWGKSWTAYLGKCFSATQLKLAWLSFAGCAVAACINPQVWKIYVYVYELAGNTIGEKYIQEWQPPTWSDGSNAVFFCCSIATLVMLILLAERFRNKQKEAAGEVDTKSTFGALGVRPGELLVIAAFIVMGLRNVRSIIWFGLLFIVVGTALVCCVFPAAGKNEPEMIPPSMQKMNALLAIMICCLAIPFLPQFKPLLPWPENYLKHFAPASQMQAATEFKNTPPMILAANTPVAATEFLRRNPPKGLLWNDMVFGSYLVWANVPAQGPWADPRVELRPDNFWETYVATCHAKNNPGVNLPQRGFSEVLIDKKAENEKELTKNLRSSPRWKIIYEDGVSLLFQLLPQGESKMSIRD